MWIASFIFDIMKTSKRDLGWLIKHTKNVSRQSNELMQIKGTQVSLTKLFVTVLQIHKFYTIIMKIIFELTFWTIILHRNECVRDIEL